jgi:hypothetical protein
MGVSSENLVSPTGCEYEKESLGAPGVMGMSIGRDGVAGDRQGEEDDEEDADDEEEEIDRRRVHNSCARVE